MQTIQYKIVKPIPWPKTLTITKETRHGTTYPCR